MRTFIVLYNSPIEPLSWCRKRGRRRSIVPPIFFSRSTCVLCMLVRYYHIGWPHSSLIVRRWWPCRWSFVFLGAFVISIDTPIARRTMQIKRRQSCIVASTSLHSQTLRTSGIKIRFWAASKKCAAVLGEGGRNTQLNLNTLKREKSLIKLHFKHRVKLASRFMKSRLGVSVRHSSGIPLHRKQPRSVRWLHFEGNWLLFVEDTRRIRMQRTSLWGLHGHVLYMMNERPEGCEGEVYATHQHATDNVHHTLLLYPSSLLCSTWRASKAVLLV